MTLVCWEKRRKSGDVIIQPERMMDGRKPFISFMALLMVNKLINAL